MSDELMRSFKSASELFGEAAVIGALREEFADVCSHTDVMVHGVIDYLDKKLHVCPDGYSIEIVARVLSVWIEQKELTPDPWWAC